MPEPIWLSRILLDQMHAELIREYGGSPGIRDANLYWFRVAFSHITIRET